MASEMQWEIRWFEKETAPHEVVSWFQGAALCEFLAPPEQRTDLYLFIVDPSVSVKLRGGKLEIKRREDAESFEHRKGVSGRAEYWRKWAWKDTEGGQEREILKSLDKVSGAAWIRVAKERQQRKYALDAGEFVPVPVDARLSRGCAVELTKLRVDGNPWWSLALDLYGEKEKGTANLHLWAEKFFAEYPGPELRTEASSGYPEWLSKLPRKT